MGVSFKIFLIIFIHGKSTQNDYSLVRVCVHVSTGCAQYSHVRRLYQFLSALSIKIHFLCINCECVSLAVFQSTGDAPTFSCEGPCSCIPTEVCHCHKCSAAITL